MTSLALVVLGGGLASFVRTTMLNRAEDRIASRLRSNAFRSLLTKRDMEWFHMETVGDNEREDDNRQTDKKEKTSSRSTGMTPGAVENILNEDVNQVSHSLTANVANLIRSTCSISYSTYHMLHINPGLFGLSFSVVPLIGSAAMVLRKFIKRVAAKQRETATLAASFAEERLVHIAMVKMSNRELDEVEEYTKLQEECVRLGRQVSVANGAFMGFIFAASSGALFMVFNAGGKAVAGGRMTAGDLTSFATYTFLLGLGTSGVFKALSEIMQGMDSAERVYRLIDGPSTEETTETKETPSPVKVNVDATAVDSVLFNHVFFAYKTDPEKNVLRDVSFELRRGQVVALVGKNGSGKTTIASLLAALYKPKSGSIMLPDGIDYSSLDRKVQKQLIQVVPQNPALFNTSVLENVKYSCPEATNEQAMNVMTTANCSGFVSKLDGGIQYQVGQNGGKLSAGQRQRIGLARALLSDPACLVLDEPTSSLDAEGQSAVADAVLACRGNDKSPGRALLLITHRAKSLQVANIVLVIHDGEIVERGDFQELSKKKDSQLCALMPDLV
jgi:ABC-type multidrug transport system fused ATPase/permease subunit